MLLTVLADFTLYICARIHAHTRVPYSTYKGNVGILVSVYTVAVQNLNY